MPSNERRRAIEDAHDAAVAISRFPPKRLEVVSLSSQGYLQSVVAEKLGMSPATVRNHMTAAYNMITNRNWDEFNVKPRLSYLVGRYMRGEDNKLTRNGYCVVRASDLEVIVEESRNLEITSIAYEYAVDRFREILNGDYL